MKSGFDQILRRLHEASLDDSRWPEASALINEVSQTRGNVLVSGEGRSKDDARFFLMRVCRGDERRPDWERKYLEEYWLEDPSVMRIRGLPDGRLVSTGDLFTDGERKVSPVYNELLHDTDAQNSLYTRWDGPEGSVITWTLTDSHERDGWGSEQIRLIQSLQPHVRHFVAVRQVLADAGALGTSLDGLLGSTHFGVLQLDRRGRIVTANDGALKLLRAGDGLVDADGFLRARAPGENAKLSQLLADALPRFGAGGAGGSMVVGRYGSAPPLAVYVSPAGERLFDFRPRRIAALVLIVDPNQRAQVDPSVVGMAFGLTAAESRLAVALAAGHSLRDIAGMTGRQEATVRWHLKQIFGKLGISRQVDLVRHVLRLEGFPGPFG